MKTANEEGEPVLPIYDTEGRLTAIIDNCDTILTPSRWEEKVKFVEGIKLLARELIASAKQSHEVTFGSDEKGPIVISYNGYDVVINPVGVETDPVSCPGSRRIDKLEEVAVDVFLQNMPHGDKVVACVTNKAHLKGVDEDEYAEHPEKFDCSEHEPDFDKATLSEDPSIVDVPCAKCGLSGSYTADTRPESVQW